MPRKAAAKADNGSTDAAEPRRSSRIKDIPKPEPVAKKPAKPRAKKADKEKDETAEGEEATEKPKSARGKKRKEPEEANGTAAAEAPAADGEAPAEPAAKKVSATFISPRKHPLIGLC
jgi:hypothetical protein